MDEFAHTNVPGSERAKRWQDVEVLLDAGIERLDDRQRAAPGKLNDQVCHITGVRVRETVPDWVVDAADEVVMVDVTPRALRNRLDRGVVYAPEKARKALENFFTEAKPGRAARDGAAPHGARSGGEAARRARPAGAHPDLPDGAAGFGHADPARQARGGLSARRMRRGLRSEVAAKMRTKGWSATCASRGTCTSGPKCSTAAMWRKKSSRSPVAQGITQVFMGRPRPRGRWELQEAVVQRVVRMGKEMEITVVAERRR